MLCGSLQYLEHILLKNFSVALRTTQIPPQFGYIFATLLVKSWPLRDYGVIFRPHINIRELFALVVCLVLPLLQLGGWRTLSRSIPFLSLFHNSFASS